MWLFRDEGGGGSFDDEDPIQLLEDDLVSDDALQNYQFDLTEYLGSVTSGNGEVDLTKIMKIHLYINAGLTGKISSGSFWLDTIKFTRSSE